MNLEYNNNSTFSASEKPPDTLCGRTILLVHIAAEKKAFTIRRMKELGVRIVALHTEITPWAAPFIDDWILVSPNDDTRTILDHIRTYQKQHSVNSIEGAITFWEEEVPLLAHVCEEFGFTGNNVEAGFNTRSKYAMQEQFRRNGCHAVNQYLLHSHEDLHKAMQMVGFPSVMKPLYGSDSIYVVYVENAKEAQERYRYISQNCYLPDELLTKYDKGAFVYQEYVDGKEFSVECFAQDGIPHVVGIHEKTSIQLPFFMETGDIAPSHISEQERHLLELETLAGLRALGVCNSLAHVEIKLSSKGPQIIEVGARIGADDIFNSTREAYGCDLVQIGCEIALGIEVKQRPIRFPRCTYARYFIPRHSGVIIAMEGFEKLRQHPAVIDFYIGAYVGDTIHVPPDGYEVAGWVLVKGDSHASCEQSMEEVMSNVNLEVKPYEITPYTPNTALAKVSFASLN